MESTSPDETVVLNDRYGITPGERLPDLDSPTAQAFAAVDLHTPQADLFALVCERNLPPRTDVLGAFVQLSREAIVAPEDWGVVDWPAAGERRNVIILQRPLGARVQPLGGELSGPVREADLKYKLVVPLVAVFQAMETQVLSHGAIRADNLFFADSEHSSVILGEAVSGPAGYSQPSVYETIERGMAMPAGRGPSQPFDDMYALGVLLAILALGRDPCAGMSAEEVVAAKLRDGTYGAILGQTRVPISIMELLRGLLCDEVEERWSAQDLEMWLSGRHMTPNLPTTTVKAQRPFEFAGQPYWTARSLAHAMAHDWSEAVRTLQRGEIVDWVRRSLSDDDTAEAFSELMQGGVSSSAPAQARDVMLAEALILFDPRAPVRYKAIAANVESIGQALAIEFDKSSLREQFGEVISGRLPHAWFAAQEMVGPNMAHVRKDFELGDSLISQWGTEIGLVLCLYQFNPEWPCRSPLLDRRNVTDLETLLMELEGLAAGGPPEGSPVDLHIATFCAAKFRRFPKRLLEPLLGSEDGLEKRLAAAGLLAQVQRDTGRRRLPALGSWIAGLLSPVIEAFQNRVYRRWLGEQVQRLGAEGELMQLAALSDDPEASEQDGVGFGQAKAQFLQTVQETQWLDSGGLTNRIHIMHGSRQVATVVSAILSGTALVLLSLAYAI